MNNQIKYKAIADIIKANPISHLPAKPNPIPVKNNIALIITTI